MESTKQQLANERIKISSSLEQVKITSNQEPPVKDSEFKPPEVPVLGIILTIVCPVLITVLPGVFSNNSISWPTRIIIGLSCACVFLFIMFFSTFLQNYKAAYRCQVLDLKVDRLDAFMSNVDELERIVTRTLNLIDQTIEVDNKTMDQIESTKDELKRLQQEKTMVQETTEKTE